MPTQRVANEPMVLLHELTPATVAELGSRFRGADNIGEEDGRQKALGLAPRHVRESTTPALDFNSRGRLHSD